LKIAYLIPYFQPRMGYSEYYLLTELKRSGHDVCIITSDRRPPNEIIMNPSVNRRAMTGKFIEYGLTVYRLPTLYDFGIMTINYGLKIILDSFKPDIIHCASLFSLSSFLPIIYKKKFRYKIFFNSLTGEFDPKGVENLYFNIYKRIFANYISKNSNGFFAICDGSKKWLSKHFAVPGSSINIIPLGADNNLFVPNQKNRRLIRDNFGILDDEVLLIFAGRITPGKDIDILIKSMKLIIHDHSKKIKLMIIGNGPQKYLKYLREYISLKNIDNNIIFVSTVDRIELPKYYNAADIAVWPGNPAISLIEAMSTALPIIICKYPEKREDAFDTCHLLEYENGLSFYRGDYVALANCIIKLICDKDLREKMGNNSRKLVNDKLNWVCIAHKTLKIYEEDKNTHLNC